MAFSVAWDESSPPGSTPADTIDTEIQDDKTAVRERIETLFPGWTDDGEDPKIIPAWLLRKTDTESLIDVALLPVDWNVEDRDTDSFITVTSDTVIIPAGQNGLYLLDIAIAWTPSAVGVRILSLEVNGVLQATNIQTGFTGFVNYTHLSKTLLLAATDAIIVKVQQNSGAPLIYGNVGVNTFENYFSGIRIGG